MRPLPHPPSSPAPSPEWRSCHVGIAPPLCSCSDRDGEPLPHGHDGPHTCVCGAAWNIVDHDVEFIRPVDSGWPATETR